MLSRRAVLGVAAAGAAAIGASALLTSRASASGGLPFTVTNSTGRFPDSAISMYVLGVDLESGQQGVVTHSGVFTPASSLAAGADGFADIAIPLATVTGAPFVLPWMSGRIYFSIGAPLRFPVVTDGAGSPALAHPAGWVDTDPNFGTLYDFCEFTYSSAGMFCNTTMVDMFSIPIALRLSGAGESATGKLKDAAREQIFDAVLAQAGFESLVIGDRLRVIAPGHAIDTGRFDPGYLDAGIAAIWEQYAQSDLRVTTSTGGPYTGRVAGDELRFDGGVRAFPRPSTRDVFYCNGALDAPNDAVSGAVAAILGAGLNRSVLRFPDQPTTDRSLFYQDAATNHYARILHEHTADGRAYGFPFDDVGDEASYIQDTAPRLLEITLTPFGAGGSGTVDLPVAIAPGEPGGTPAPANTRDAYADIVAAEFTQSSGVSTQPCSEGGQNIGNIANGDWVSYAGVDFGDSGTTQFLVRAASGADAGVSGLVEIRADAQTAQPLGSIAVAGTGGWQAWRTVPGTMAPLTGVHDIYVTFTSGQPQEYVNISWLRFTR